MLVLAAFLTAFYMFRVVFIAFLGAPGARPPGHGEAHAHDAPAIMAAAALDPGRAGDGHRHLASSVSHPAAEFAPPGWLTPLAVAVAGAGIALAWLVYGRA